MKRIIFYILLNVFFVSICSARIVTEVASVDAEMSIPCTVTISIPANSDTAVICGSAVTLTANPDTNGTYTYSWMPGTLPGQTVTVSPSLTTTYTVTATRTSDSTTCTATQVINVITSANLLDSFPNIITPNGDHLNDSLSLYHPIPHATDCWSNFHIKIYNRWGELQNEFTDINFHWGGTNKSGSKLKEGVYYYVITATYLGSLVSKKGTVNIKM